MKENFKSIPRNQESSNLDDFAEKLKIEVERNFRTKKLRF